MQNKDFNLIMQLSGSFKLKAERGKLKGES
jgi:hypothetical protein